MATDRGPSRRFRSGTSANRGRDAATLEGAGDDQTLDFVGALPDPVYAQLTVEPLGYATAHVTASAEGLHRAVRAAACGLGHEQFCHRRLGVDELHVGF